MSITKKVNQAKKQIEELEKVINSIEIVGIPELMRLRDEETNQDAKNKISDQVNKEFDRVWALKLEAKELQWNVDFKFQAKRLLHAE
jgi:hypothetical protein